MKRFSQDLLKVLKSQASKQVKMEEFPSAYQRTFGRTFDIIEYGVCEIQDLLIEVPEGMLTVSMEWKLSLHLCKENKGIGSASPCTSMYNFVL